MRLLGSILILSLVLAAPRWAQACPS